MARINRGPLPAHKGRIPDPSRPQDVPLRFSFKHVTFDNPKFGPQRCRQGYIEQFLLRLRDISTMTVGEFRTNKSKALRVHRHDFAGTTEPSGFTTLNEQLRAKEAWQFQLTSNEHGRVHGMLVNDTFYVIWIDPDHELYL